MKLRYLHLSDLQLGSLPLEIEKEQDTILNAMLDTLRNMVDREEFFDFIIITGDLARQGKTEDYQIVEAFCKQLLEVTKLPRQRLLIVPGNHDVDRSALTREDITFTPFKNQHAVSQVLDDPVVFPKLMNRFAPFNAFAEKAMGRRLFDETKYHFTETLELKKNGEPFKVNFVGLNSALFSGIFGDDIESTVLEPKQVKRALKELDSDASLSIAFFHHPVSCQTIISRAAQFSLPGDMDMILTGHSENICERFDLIIGHSYTIGTGLNNGLKPPNSFNVVDIDLSTGNGKLQFYKYLPQHSLWKKDTDANPKTEDGGYSLTIHSLKSNYLARQDDAFRLTRVELKNIQGFESLKVGLAPKKSKPINFTLLLGDNSTGKTSFLRSLAVGMCEEVEAAALLDNIHGKFITNGQTHGIITIHLDLPGEGIFRIDTFVERSGNTERVKKQYYHILDEGKAEELVHSEFPWNRLFVCGYGAGRTLGQLREKHEEYRFKNAVGSLFRYDQPLQDPELNLRKLGTAARSGVPRDQMIDAENNMLQRFMELIGSLFMFTGNEHIELTARGIEVVTEIGRTLLLSQGDGYKNTSAWVLDLSAWNMLAGRKLEPDAISGIVLLDEIEQHLHPKWQRYIIKLLRKQFPKLQFIAATHSPLCAAGSADLDDGEYAVFRFKKETDKTVALNPLYSLRGLRADQVLTSEAFDLPTTRNPEVAGKLKRFGDLFLLESRSESEESEYHKLGVYLKKHLPETAEDAENRLLQKELKKRLDEVESIAAGYKAMKKS
ncbi:MAG: AAA family ATPase [bacterium]|nr:AAA family ATPase [bacterium]